MRETQPRESRYDAAAFPVKFAYADPPYPGQSKRWYADHPAYAGEIDHAELIGRLVRDYPDGWALSTNAVSLQSILALCPPDVRIAVWHNTNASPPGRLGPWWWCWEPLLVSGGRRSGGPVRNVLSCGTHRQGRFPGGKPPEFCRWVFALLGAEAGDELDDLFPGSGAVGKARLAYKTQPWMEYVQPSSPRRLSAKKRERRLRNLHVGPLPDMTPDTDV